MTLTFNGIEDMRRECREQGVEEGVKQGLKQGVMQTLAGLVDDGLLPLDEAARRSGLTPAEFEAQAAELRHQPAPVPGA